MASNVSQIVSVNITQETSSVPQQGFGVPLIIGPSNRFDEVVRTYTSPEGMLGDGFQTSDPEYIHAVSAFSQALTPENILVGKTNPSTSQVDTLTVNTLSTSHAYTLTLNSTPISYTSLSTDTESSVLNTLLTQITNANLGVSGSLSGSGSGATLTLTSSTPGLGISYTGVDSNLTLSQTTANHSIIDDLQAIQAVNDTWYGLITTSKTKSDLLQAASYIETQKKIYIASTHDSDALNNVSGNVLSQLQAKSYKRTAVLYSSQASISAPEAGWVGQMLPTVPGSSTWKFKTIVGSTPDSFTPSQRQNLIGSPGVPGLNANLYEVVGGVPITEEGTMASGQFIDITIGIDWLESTMQTNVYSLLTQNSKIPYTNDGIALIENAVRQTIKQAINNGLVDGDSGYSVSVPQVSDISQNQRAQRVLPNVKFQCRLAGALHFVQINGTVTV